MAGLIAPFTGRRNARAATALSLRSPRGEPNMNAIIYLVGLIVIILAILSFVGMR